MVWPAQPTVKNLPAVIAVLLGPFSRLRAWARLGYTGIAAQDADDCRAPKPSLRLMFLPGRVDELNTEIR